MRLFAWLFAYPFALLTGLLLILQVMAVGCLSYSPPLYSPDHLKAARIRTDDEGGLGGNTHVELFSNHGLSSTEVYWGGWLSVGLQDIRWLGNTELEIKHDGPVESCTDAPTVKVRCVAKTNH